MNTANNFTTAQVNTINILKEELKHEKREKESLIRDMDTLKSQLIAGNLTLESKAL